MGMFNDDDDVPEINMTEYTPIKASNTYQPINFMQMYDDITGEEFSFIRGRDGNRYLEIKQELDNLNRSDYTMNDGFRVRDHYPEFVNDKKRELETELRKEEEGLRFNQEHNINPGEMRMQTRSSQNRFNIDLPEVEPLSQFTMQQAAAVANVTSRLRDLGETINSIEGTDPMFVRQNAGVINSFKEASQRALDKGFNIYQNGFDEKLKQMGLDNSSTAIGVQIALQREKTDKMIENNFKTYQLAQGMKQNTIDNMYKLGNQVVNEGRVELEKYNSESRNQLAHQGMVQDRSKNLMALKLQREQQDAQRSLVRQALPFVTNENAQGLQAIMGDNNAFQNMQRNELSRDQLGLEQFKLEQMSKTNPLDALTNIAGTGIGAFAGGYGSSLGKALGKAKGEA